MARQAASPWTQLGFGSLRPLSFSLQACPPWSEAHRLSPPPEEAQPTSGPACVLQIHDQNTDGSASSIPFDPPWLRLTASSICVLQAWLPSSKAHSGGGTVVTEAKPFCCRHAQLPLVAQQLANPPVLSACPLAPGCKQPHRPRSCQSPTTHPWPCAAVLRRLHTC